MYDHSEEIARRDHDSELPNMNHTHHTVYLVLWRGRQWESRLGRFLCVLASPPAEATLPLPT